MNDCEFAFESGVAAGIKRAGELLTTGAPLPVSDEDLDVFIAECRTLALASIPDLSAVLND